MTVNDGPPPEPSSPKGYSSRAPRIAQLQQVPRIEVRDRRPLQKTVENGLGRKLYKDFLVANLVAGRALIAILTWDLASTDHYTVGDRAELSRPWTSVAPLPHIDDSA